MNGMVDAESVLKQAGITHAFEPDWYEISERCRKSHVNGIKIAYINEDFQGVLFRRSEIDIEGVESAKLAYYDLQCDAPSLDIIAEIGGENGVISPVHFWSLVKRESDQEGSSALLVNGNKNVFHIRDSNGVLHTINVNLTTFDDGWFLRAHLLGRSSKRWRAGDRVFAMIPIT